MSNIKAYKINKLPIKIHGNQIVQQKYKGVFTKKQIKEHAQEVVKKLKEKGFDGKIMVTLKYDEYWRSGYFTDIQTEQPISLYDPTDSNLNIMEPKNFIEFRIYIMKKPPKEGG